MAKKRFVLLVLLMGLVLASGCSASAAQSADAVTPEQVAQDFYAWYLAYPGNPLVDDAHHTSPYLTEAFVQKIDEIRASFTLGGYDPVLCAQDIPQTFAVGEAVVRDDQARLEVQTSFHNHSFTVSLRQMDGQWKISDVVCREPQVTLPLPEEPVPASPEEVVNDFYNWYLAYAREVGNPLAEGAYRSSEYLSPAFVQQVDETLASFDKGGYDPFLCAQDVPQNFTIPEASVSPQRTVVRVETSFSGHAFQVAVESVDGRWHITDVVCAPEGAPAPPLDEVSYQAVQIPAAGVGFEVPAGWFRQEPEWLWTPDEAGEAQIGVNWTDLQPPMEPEAVLLPDPAQILGSEPVDLGWGQGRRFTLEVYAPGTEGEDARAPVAAVETHVLVTVRHGEARRGFDFYARAPNAERLAALDPLLAHLLDSTTLTLTPERGPVPDADPSLADWQRYEDGTYGFRLQYPPDWTFQVIEIDVNDANRPPMDPIQAMVQFLPQTWAEQMKPGGPPDPTQPPIVAPLSLEVSVGSPEQYRWAYIEPTHSEELELGGNRVTLETYASGEIREMRYLFQHPEKQELRITIRDQISGFPARAEGNRAIIEVANRILTTFEFTE